MSVKTISLGKIQLLPSLYIKCIVVLYFSQQDHRNLQFYSGNMQNKQRETGGRFAVPIILSNSDFVERNLSSGLLHVL